MLCFRINVLFSRLGPTENKDFYLWLFSIFRFSAKKLCGQKKPQKNLIAQFQSQQFCISFDQQCVN